MLASKKSTDVLQKRIPKNPKYENIESTIDTGSSLNRYLKRIEDIRQNYRIRKDELFKRMKCSTFVQLVLQVAEINNHLYCSNQQQDNNHCQPGNIDDNMSTARTNDTVTTHRSTFQGVINGVGELDMNNTNSVQPSQVITCENESDDPVVYDTMPYLLLDVRDRDQYDQCHIIKSVSYPSAMISRSVNFETKEMLACRNKPGKIIIIYDEEERIAPRVADTLVQRGYDNLFMLSGGLRVAYKKFPKGLITGKISESIRQAVNSKPKQKSVKAGDLPATSQSHRSTQSNAVSLSDPVEIRSDFTLDDLANLSTSLDAALDSQSSVGSSIYSSHHSKGLASRASVTGSLTASTGQIDHKKPFKC